MKTIGAKELRLHLDEIFDRVLGGEEIIVNHRFKGPVKISALTIKTASNATKLSGLQAFDAAPKQASPYSSNASIKELYSNSIAKKYAR